MLAVNVQESTTTTGTGNITLAGSSEDGRTFTSQYDVNARFTYYIDDRAGGFENGIGYLSSSTVLVREVIIDSSNSGALVNFGAGTKQVYVGSSTINTMSQSSLEYSNIGGIQKYATTSNFVSRSATVSLSANRIYYIPALITRASVIDSLGVRVAIGAGTASDNLIIGLYEADPTTANPGNRIFSTGQLDPSVSAFVTGSVVEKLIQPGWYYLAVWCDVSPTLRGSPSSSLVSSPYYSFTDSILSNATYSFINNQLSLTELPATGNATSIGSSSIPLILLGHS